MVDGTCSSKSYNVGSLSCPLCICASVDEIAIYQAPLCHNYGTIGFLNVGWMIFEAPQGFHPKSGLERWWQEEASKNYNKNKKRYVCTLSRMCDFIPHQVHQFIHKHAETLLHTKRMWCLASTLHWKVVCYELCVLAYLLGIDEKRETWRSESSKLFITSLPVTWPRVSCSASFERVAGWNRDR